MNKNFIRLLSLLLVSSMILSIASCGKKNSSNTSESHSGKKISEDSPWFNSMEIEIDLGVDQSRPVDYIGPNFAGADDKYIVVFTSGYYKMPANNGTDKEMLDNNDYALSFLSVYDRAANKTINIIDLKKSLTADGFTDVVSYSDGTIKVNTVSYNPATYETSITETELDPLTGKVLGSRTVDTNERNGVDRSFYLGKYRVDTAMNWNQDQSYYTLRVYSPDGSMKETEIKESGKIIYGIPAILLVTDTTALVCEQTDKENLFYKLDLEKCTVNLENSKDYAWLNVNSLGSSQMGRDGQTYFYTTLGISRIDMDKKTNEMVFDYNWCGINRDTLNYLSPVECKGDSFLLCGTKYSVSPFNFSNIPEFIVYEFTKADKNPHAGKTILELYSSSGYLEDTLGDTVLKYNDNSSDYFIEVTDRYNKDSYFENISINSIDEWETYNITVNSKMSNALAIDIINGNGPDILLNTSTYGQLNNSSYLVDLTPYVSTLSADKYYTNITDGAKCDGSLYQLPITFGIEGIQTDYEYAGSSGVGFTVSEYEEFLYDTLNGKDVITAGQALYFAKLFSASGDLFIKNGKADFSGPEFEALAKYVKNNVPESAESWNSITDGNVQVTMEETASPVVGAKIFKGLPRSEQRALYGSLNSIANYLSIVETLNGSTAILGIPSPDGRGPMFYPNISVAVSAQAVNKDACGEFVKMLLSDDVQSNLAMNNNIVINREALRQASKVAIDYYNQGNSFIKTKFTDSIIDDLERVILSCSRMNSADSEIMLILMEEMPAYFLGQKDLDAVVKIAQDRVQKVLDERG